MITFRQKGNFSKLSKFLEKQKSAADVTAILNKFGQAGVAALSSATPVDSGETASSWRYEIKVSNGRYTLDFLNSNIVDGVPIAVIIQYGHATGTGGWVEGRDYINPAIQPLFDKIADDAWKEVTKA